MAQVDMSCNAIATLVDNFKKAMAEVSRTKGVLQPQRLFFCTCPGPSVFPHHGLQESVQVDGLPVVDRVRVVGGDQYSCPCCSVSGGRHRYSRSN